MSHDASPTWSGFNYQGKIALFHVLKEIGEMLGQDPDFCFNDYKLIVEQHEDFDIEGPDGYISFHQVKAINNNSFSTYSNALLEMILNVNSFNQEEVIGKLHTWKRITIPEDEPFNEKLKGVVQEVVSNYNDSDDKSKTYIGKAIDVELKNIDKRSAIIRKCYKDDINKFTAENIIDELSLIVEEGDNSVLTRVSQYDYSTNELSCDIDDINEKVKDGILSVLRLKGLVRAEVTLDRIFEALLGKIDRHIIDRHNNVNNGNPIPIPFNDLIEIAIDEGINDTNEEYVAYRFKFIFMKAFDTFLHDPDLCSEETANKYYSGESCNLNSVTDILFYVSPNGLWEHYKNFCPHINLSGKISTDNASNIDNKSIYLSLLPIFNDLDENKKYYNKKRKTLLYKNNGIEYLPTTIGDDTKTALVKSLIESINNTVNLFEVSTFVTGERAPRIEGFEEHYDKYANVSIYGFNADIPIQNQEKIYEIKKNLRLIPLSEAKGEINDD